MSATNIPNALLYIGGKAVQSSIRIEWRDIPNSAIQEVVAGVPFATKVKVDLVVANAKQTFRTCRNSSLAQRIMLKFQQLLCENTAPLAELITREHGKILPDAEGRAQQVVDGLILVGVRRHDAIDVAGRKARTDRLIGAGGGTGHVMLPASLYVEGAYLGASSILIEVGPDALLIDFSTIVPDPAHKVDAAAARERLHDA